MTKLMNFCKKSSDLKLKITKLNSDNIITIDPYDPFMLLSKEIIVGNFIVNVEFIFQNNDINLTHFKNLSNKITIIYNNLFFKEYREYKINIKDNIYCFKILHFHINDNMSNKLIEINTDAKFELLDNKILVKIDMTKIYDIFELFVNIKSLNL
jgi:hypothetical protein